ncbi:hypothetical protein [Mesoplasma melaleucae]|uniref:hypothetical protein n=1 Tax=Mesoplasma melaleucae TaxID=81459 RepID=UPI00048567A4|nr:hypothetical protein [Mesoplasma melaleucae]
MTLKFDYDFKMTAKTIINEQSIQELNSNEVIKCQSLVTARLDKIDDYIFSVELSNSKAQDKTLMNKKYFKKRPVSINKIKISIIPKINYDILKDDTIALEHESTRTGIQLEEINKIVNEQLVQIIDIKGINSNIFFYLFDGINFLQEDISDLSSINLNLEYKMNVSCGKSYVIKNDAFFEKYVNSIN